MLEKDPQSTNDLLIFTTTRMLPPGELTYYYSVNGVPSLNEDEIVVNSIITKKSTKLRKLNVPKTNIIDNVI